MEGQWNMVPELTLLQVEKALREYLTQEAILSFGSLQPNSQATGTLSAVVEKEVECDGLGVGSR